MFSYEIEKHAVHFILCGSVSSYKAYNLYIIVKSCNTSED